MTDNNKITIVLNQKYSIHLGMQIDIVKGDGNNVEMQNTLQGMG